MDKYYIVAENPESTVVAEYQTPYIRETAYQTEDQLEKAFIQLLQGQAYDYLKINSEAELVNNLRVQLQKLNNYTFSNNEWDHFFKSKIANPNSGIEKKTTLAENKQKCIDAQSRLRLFLESPRLRMPDGEGGLAYVDDNVREQKINEANQAVTTYCK